MSVHDTETGLPGPVLLVDRLSVATQRGGRTGAVVALALVDAGEDLDAVAAALRTVLRAGDTVARAGRRELAVIADDLADAADADAFARRALAVLTGRGAAVGLTAAEGAARDPRTMLTEANAALERARRRGGGVEAFDPGLLARGADRARVDAELARAIAGGELRLHYQPIVGLEDGVLRGVEALVRWEHPEQGLLAPAEFLSVAERSGAIVPLGSWVLRDACRQVAAWHAARSGLEGFRHFRLAVNVSAKQLAHPVFGGVVEAALAESGLAADLLCLEVPESDLPAAPAAVDALRRLRAIGVRIAVDDATGLWRARAQALPVDVLKASPEHLDAVVVTRPTGADVVAVQIEEREQELDARRAGVGLAQGFLYARPVPAAEFAALLDLQTPAAQGAAAAA